MFTRGLTTAPIPIPLNATQLIGQRRLLLDQPWLV